MSASVQIQAWATQPGAIALFSRPLRTALLQCHGCSNGGGRFLRPDGVVGPFPPLLTVEGVAGAHGWCRGQNDRADSGERVIAFFVRRGCPARRGNFTVTAVRVGWLHSQGCGFLLDRGVRGLLAAE